ncbi:MAG: hypothetical protein C0453_12470 [Comamonadaceae bacterium]|nr:hypothetical protein [Comamonadaceae bacterium]
MAGGGGVSSLRAGVNQNGAGLPNPDPDTQVTLVRRAKAARFDTGGQETPDESSGYASEQGLGCVVLRAAGTTLAVYRVRSDNLMLRRMKRPPKGLT